MLTSFYTASTGAIELKKGMDVTANNIANVSTTGYQPIKSAFSDLVYTTIHQSGGPVSGHGTKLQKTDTVFAGGSLQQTERKQDYALTGTDEFFAVRSGNGVRYTRNGNFHISLQAGGNYLVDSEGGYVLDASGRPVTVQNEDATANVGVFSFQNCGGLLADGDSYYTATAASGAPRAVAQPEVKQGYLENSAVSVADEMVSVLQLQRGFQFNSKIVQISDEIMQTVNNMR